MPRNLTSKEKLGWAAAAFLALLFGYVFLLPVAVILPGDEFWARFPDTITGFVGDTIVPLDWLFENFRPYKEYIVWLEGFAP